MVEIGTAAGTSNSGVFETATASQTVTLPAGSYFGRVKARNAMGTGAASHEVAFEIGAPGLTAPWPMYGRGANRSSLASVNGPSNANVVWSLALDGFLNTNNSPVVGSDGSLYISTWLNFYAITPSGSIRCQRGSIASSAPAVSHDGTKIYLAERRQLTAIDPITCAVLWEYPAGSTYSSPAVGRDGTVYLGSSDGRLVALTPSGAVKWIWDGGIRACGIESSPALAANGDVYVQHNCIGVVAVTANGIEKWRRGGPGDVWNGPSVGPNGTLYVADSPGFYALNLDGTVRWNITELTNFMYNAAPAISADGRTIFRGDNNGYFFAFDSAGTIKWRYYTGLTGTITSAPAIAANGIVYFTQGSIFDAPNQGYVYAVRESDGTFLWRTSIGSSDASPAIGADGTLYVAGTVSNNGSRLYAIR